MADLRAAQAAMRARWIFKGDLEQVEEEYQRAREARSAARKRPEAHKARKRAEWVTKNLDRIKDRRYRQKYGITLEEFRAIVAKQGNRCAACRREFVGEITPNADHDHVSGRFRGALCGYCNTILGQAKDSIAALEGCIEYLKGF